MVVGGDFNRMTGAAWWRRKSWLLLVGYQLGRLGVAGGEAVEAAGVLDVHHDVPVRHRCVERWQVAPLLLRDCAGDIHLPQRLDVIQPRLPGEGTALPKRCPG